MKTNRPLPPDTPAPSYIVRVLAALYGGAERVPFWAAAAWREGWRPVLHKQSIIEAAQAAHKERVRQNGNRN